MARFATLNHPDPFVRARLQAALYYARKDRKERAVDYPRLNIIRTEGDSLMNGAYGNATKTTLDTLLPLGWSVSNTAVGGSTMTDIRNRVTASGNAYLTPQTTVFWDGSQNGYTTASEYVDLLEEAISLLGHSRFLVVPAIVPYGGTYAGSQAEAIREEMLSRWWGFNVMDWRDYLHNTDGSIESYEFHLPGSDVWHISAGGAARIGLGIIKELRAREYLDDAIDPIASNGSVWLLDPTHDDGAFTGVPAEAALLPNPVWGTAASLIGSGDADSLSTRNKVYGTVSGADILAERTSKGGLHVIMSQNSAYGNQNQGFRLAPRTLIQQYLDGLVSDDWFFSIWLKVTRKPINPPGGTPATNSSPQSVMHKAQNTSNLLFHMQGLDSTAASSKLGEANLPSAQNYAGVTLGAALLRNVGTTSYLGTKPSLGASSEENANFGLAIALGSFDAWSFFNNGCAPSIILYRAYAEHLTASGRSYSDVSAIDTLLFNEAFGEGGRFYDDSYTDPATFP